MLSGRALHRQLESLGIAAQKVVRKQETGDYVADFYQPEMNSETAPAKEWAKQIKKTFPQAQIVGTHDTIASWRPGNPVIYATVIFQLPDNNAA